MPPRCPGCGTPVDGDDRFCSECWRALRFVGPPWCAGCHLPFDFDPGSGALCDGCETSGPQYAGARAAVAYGPIARQLALKLKYGGRIGIADTMAGFMIRHVPMDTELVVPVPLHRWRLWTRGYNQAALIAHAVARRVGADCASDLLVRSRRTPVLRGMSGRERARAVAGAFTVKVASRARLAGRRVLLVDDVYTTGATAGACAMALQGAGAAEVTVLCWARVLTGDD